MKAKFEHLSMYSSSDDELILILPDDCQYFDKIKDLVNKYSTAVKIDGFEVRMPLKAGIYNFGGKTESPIEIYNKSRVASEQEKLMSRGFTIMTFRSIMNEKNCMKSQVHCIRL